MADVAPSVATQKQSNPDKSRAPRLRDKLKRIAKLEKLDRPLNDDESFLVAAKEAIQAELAALAKPAPTRQVAAPAKPDDLVSEEEVIKQSNPEKNRARRLRDKLQRIAKYEKMDRPLNNDENVLVDSKEAIQAELAALAKPAPTGQVAALAKHDDLVLGEEESEVKNYGDRDVLEEEMRMFRERFRGGPYQNARFQDIIYLDNRNIQSTHPRRRH